jgi:transcriptional regulator GlxA family with amidase domain
MTERIHVAIPLFPRFTALDAVGPYEVLQRIPNVDITFIGHAHGEVRTENGMLGLTADALFEEVPEPDVIVFPGGVGTRPLEQDQRVLDWATTHWACYRELAAHGAEPTSRRVVEHRAQRIMTAAGVSSGIDMALRLAELLVDRTAAQAAQLMIEYDPEPPFDCGSVAKADDIVMTRVIEYAALRQ